MMATSGISNGKNKNFRSDKIHVLPSLFLWCLLLKNAQGTENFTLERVASSTIMDKYQDEFFSSTEISLQKSEDYSITVIPFYFANETTLHLNISWTLPRGISPKHYDFLIKLETDQRKDEEQKREPFCSIFNLEIYSKSINETNIILPMLTYVYSNDIKPGCLYDIKIVGHETNKKYIATTKYRVPDCVGPVCSCRVSTPLIKLLNITQISSDLYNVTFSDHSDYKDKYNITDITFKYSRIKKSSVSFTVVANVSEKAHNYALINLPEPLLTPGNNNVITAEFQNSFNCKNASSISFQHVYYSNKQNLSTNTDFIKQLNYNNWIEVYVPLMVLLTFAALLGLLIYYRKLVRFESFKNLCLFGNANTNSSALYKIPTNTIIHNEQQVYNILYVDPLEFNRSDVTFIKEIGKGYFGKVYLAKLANVKDNTTLAVKILRENAPCEETDDFLFEIEIFKKIKGHQNVVRLIGYCTKTEPYLMVMEYCKGGDLYNYLLKLRKQWDDRHTSPNFFFSQTNSSSNGEYIVPNNASTVTTNRLPSVTDTEYTLIESEYQTPLLDKPNQPLEPILDHNELQNFAYQIANGMAYLESIPITHRDLAARNILMDANKVLKISDFGLSRSGPYINNRLRKQPLRWMAIESIEDHFFDNKSDVWSFAVVLWELGTLGAFPYENTPNDLILHDLLMGRRLQRPEICTSELYSLMLRCWSRNPNLRPTFAELVDILCPKHKKVYVDFGQLNPTYVFPPSKLEQF